MGQKLGEVQPINALHLLPDERLRESIITEGSVDIDSTAVGRPVPENWQGSVSRLPDAMLETSLH